MLKFQSAGRAGNVNIPTPRISPGILQETYQKELRRLQELGAVERLWARDTSLWNAKGNSPTVRKEQLNWLDLPDTLEGYLKLIAGAAAELTDEFESVVFIAMESSNLAAEAIAPIAEAALGKRFFVLDTVNPEDIRAIEKQTDLRRSLFLIVNKTGKVIETHTLFLYFLERLKSSGIPAPGSHFVAVTEEHSYLRELASQYRFRHQFMDPEGFPARYSGVIHYGLLLSAFCGSDPDVLLAKLKAMRDACRERSNNGAAELGAFLAAGAAEGHERLAILTSKKMIPLGHRLGQLIGESTCKSGWGIIPLVEARNAWPAEKKGKWMTAQVQFRGEERNGRAGKNSLDPDAPSVLVELEGIEDLCAEIFRWEIATSLTCALLETDPFSDPDNQEIREAAMRSLGAISSPRKTADAKPRIVQREIELHAEGRTRHDISMLGQVDALRSFLELAEPNGYLAVLSYLPRALGGWEFMLKLQESLESTLLVPVLLSSGPRYLHIAGQCYKGGPSKGIFLMLTESTLEDVTIPGAGYTFGRLGLALAEADFSALVQRERPTVRLHLRNGTEGFAELQALLEQALVGIRRAKR